MIQQAQKLSRNDPCWCGSGEKYKKCHLKEDMKFGRKRRPTVPPGVIIKTEAQIDGIRRSCQLTRDILDMLTDRIEPGITTNQIDHWVHDYMTSHGAIPATLGYRGYTKSSCTSINDVICHGIPDDETVLQDGDIINIDVTSILDGYYGDSSRMYVAGQASDQALRLIDETLNCLNLGIAEVKPGNTLGDIGHAIQKHAEGLGYSVVREWGGHGTGVQFHEEPHVSHFGRPGQGVVLVPNMTFTVEPMINIGKPDGYMLDDGWTVKTVDGELSAQWEHTVRVTETGVEVMTA